jgi:hypothetical protein
MAVWWLVHRDLVSDVRVFAAIAILLTVLAALLFVPISATATHGLRPRR